MASFVEEVEARERKAKFKDGVGQKALNNALRA